MTDEDLKKIEDFTIWLNARLKSPHLTLFIHKAPIGQIKRTGRYEVNINQTEYGHNFYTASPKDKRLEGLKFFD